MKLLHTFCIPAVLLATLASAQRPVEAGTALGGTGVTEARRADALLINPALLGIWDGGPAASHSFLALDLARLPSQGTFDGAVRLGLMDGGRRPLQYSAPLPDNPTYPGALGGVTWGAFQNRDFALALSTHAAAHAHIPPAIRAALGAGKAESAASYESGRSLATVLAVGRAVELGRLPGIGAVWAGATAKGWYLHTYARGAFVADAPGGEVYRETVFRGVPGYGLDLGVAANPGPLRLAASVSNVFAGTVQSGSGPRERSVSVEENPGGRALVTEQVGPEIGFADLDSASYTDARRAWDDALFPAVLRAGAAWDAGAGTVALAITEVLRQGGLEPARSTDRFTASVRGTERLPLRASYGWGDGARSYTLGLDAGSCARRWTLGVAYRDGSEGSSIGLSASLRLMDSSCSGAR
ncbi:MAG TPA: conjugal transfer protein TraF [Longimicrobium sp.]|jgi:hypothetical protein